MGWEGKRKERRVIDVKNIDFQIKKNHKNMFFHFLKNI